jgi:hypothetical protein
MLSTNMRSSEHSRKIAVMSKKSDQYLHVRAFISSSDSANTAARPQCAFALALTFVRLFFAAPQDMIVGCQALFPIVATHFVRLQSVYELRQKLQVRNSLIACSH